MDNEQALQDIAQEIEVCQQCRIGTTGRSVPGEGNPHAKVVFVGEAPGKTEAVTGRPFVGRSGKLLRGLIQHIGLKEKDVFITSVGKYLPLRGTPSQEQIVHGRIHLLKQLSVIKPKIVVLLGAVAAQGVLGKKVPVAQLHGSIEKDEERQYFLTVHPAAALRFTKFKKILEEDFLKLKEIISKEL